MKQGESLKNFKEAQLRSKKTEKIVFDMFSYKSTKTLKTENMNNKNTFKIK
jgi:hypothetical protein